MTDSLDAANKRIMLLESLLDASVDCVMAVDTDLKIIFWNKMCELISGKARSDVLGQGIQNIFLHLDTYEALNEALSQALKGRSYLDATRHSAFLWGYMESHFIPLKDPSDKVVGILIIGHDIAHRIKAEQKLQQLNLELQRLNAKLTLKNRELQRRNNELVSFTYAASHDLKEPLRKINIFSRLILTDENKQLSESGRSLFKRILNAINRMETLTDDMVTLSNINAASEPIVNISLDDVLLTTLQSLQQRIESADAIVKSEHLPVISGQPNLLTQLLYNLLDNALKFQPVNSRPIIRISCDTVIGSAVDHPDAIPETLYYRIGIHDNGIGFEQIHGEQIFELFKRLHSTDSYNGNGIGLPLCQKIMELHHGFITAFSVPDNGSVFVCYFPAHQ